ncbi:TPA: asparagine synthase (glutamine-hydrolyzing) [Vibrio vulnificus]|uniref:asparagine synthase (glutamine-hydrolyzing) n=1 Tax=Vibrio vulnificus TaxID=672 RepID=UPI0032ED7861
MCGISFYLSRTRKLSNQLIESLDNTRHRGPDSNGTFEVCHVGTNIGLGHNRLSIIELSDAGSQPMHHDKGYTIIFNGEIYNHNELRANLKSDNVSFKGGSDTEVILQLYIKYGVASFSMLVGMFCIVILDRLNNLVHMARDAIGIKPLYIYKHGGDIFASSEIRGLKPYLNADLVPDENDIYAFFNTGFLYEPNTGYENVKKLMPGFVLTIDIETGEVEQKEFKPLNNYNNGEDFKAKLSKAVSNQLVADVPLGVFFSGGADSSILAGMAGEADLFFAEYASDPSSDIDREYSKKIANHLGKNLVSHKFSDEGADVEQLISQVRFVAENTEELLSDYTFWATYQLSEAARKNGYKVMLSGMGGDEAFAGYPRYHVLSKHKLFTVLSPVLKLLLKFRIFPKNLDKKFERLVSYSTEKNWGVAYSRLLGYFSREELNALFGTKEKELFFAYNDAIDKLMAGYSGKKNDKVKQGQYLDRYGFLAHNLAVSDKASMLASIELRVPLLDEALVAHGFLEKSSNLIDSKSTKKPLKTLLSDYLPCSLIERPKTGFNPPIDALVTNIGEQRLISELSNLGDYVNCDFAKNLVVEHFKVKKNNSYKIWQLLYFKFWIENLKKESQ